MLKLVLYIPTLCLLSCGLAAQQKLPLNISKELSISAKATMAGQSGDYLVDTGGGVNMLSAKKAETAHAVPVGYHSGMRVTGERVGSMLSQISDLEIGPVTIKSPLVAVWDVLDQIGVPGIISAQVFRDQPVTIDFIHRELVFEDAKSLAQRKKNSPAVPLKFDDDRGESLDVFADFDFGNGQHGLCQIDTGSAQISINQRFLKLLGLENSPSVQKKEQRTVMGTMRTTYATTLPTVSLLADPSAKITNHPVIFSDIIYDCLIGNQFWEDKAFTLDIAGKNLYVTHK